LAVEELGDGAALNAAAARAVRGAHSRGCQPRQILATRQVSDMPTAPDSGHKASF
jgi:hypothetical protein